MRTPRKNQGDTAPQPPAPQTRGRRAHAGPPAEEHPVGEPPELPPPMAAAPGRITLRPRTVRAKIVSLLMVPVVSLLALWGFATVTTAQDVAGLRQLQRVDEQIRNPVTSAVVQLQAERRAALRYAAAPGSDAGAELRRQAGRTETAVAALQVGGSHTVADAGGMPAEVVDRLGAFVRGATRLDALRTAVLDRHANGDTAYEQYNAAIATGLGVNGALTGAQGGADTSGLRVQYELSRAGEALSQEDALLASAQLAHSLSGERLRAFTGAVLTRRDLTASAADLPAASRSAWQALSSSADYTRLRTAEDKVLAASPGRAAAQAAPSDAWDPSSAAVQSELRDIAAGAGSRPDPVARGLLTTSGAAVLLGLLAVAASLVISVRIGRSLVVELLTLRNSALRIARSKLPHAMQRLRSGEEIDIQAEAPQGPPAQDEIAQVGEALDTVHRAALGAAAERAELAGGISKIFVNLARRSQVLVHRQLALLDSMERRAEDPNELGDLFRLDHLTTRMRRHAESLIILSGAAPGRAWRKPVPLTNVVRAAVSEVEDYARIEVRQLSEAAVTGTTVADLTHLLAELVENAAQFSPPHTKVRVSGEPVGNGYVLEIEDRGLGMGPEALAEANRRIEQSQSLDLFDSERLGLFVISRLSARHDIKVHLRASPYGGTTAVVLLPTAILPGALTARPADRDAPERAPEPTEETPAFPAPGPRPVRADTPTTAFPAREPRPALAAPAEDTPPPPGVATLRPRTRPAEAPADKDPRSAAESDDDAELPRRVRQANLVAQLREAPPPAAPAGAAPPEDEDTAHRTPEQVRDRMTAYMGGWARGTATGLTDTAGEGDRA
ncbi:nitrate- and nitrite sensing domain-containing protein [Streptomyces sp. NBC_01465]|uniref:nitrate- and nitrite sensing domain-containing protein n=1 Tax=Streptomyces sp. NBC_01465 TaxID=2903878 RepID=UPI002E30DFF9|nr:nitrate- and nitrite sensing domain-containing protein [Streptomyces sp. NBC_01465]